MSAELSEESGHKENDRAAATTTTTTTTTPTPTTTPTTTPPTANGKIQAQNGNAAIVLNPILCFLNNFHNDLEYNRLKALIQQYFDPTQVTAANKKLSDLLVCKENGDITRAEKAVNCDQSSNGTNSDDKSLHQDQQLDRLLSSFDKLLESGIVATFATVDLHFFPIHGNSDNLKQQSELVMQIQQLKQMIAGLSDKEKPLEGGLNAGMVTSNPLADAVNDLFPTPVKSEPATSPRENCTNGGKPVRTAGHKLDKLASKLLKQHEQGQKNADAVTLAAPAAPLTEELRLITTSTTPQKSPKPQQRSSPYQRISPKEKQDNNNRPQNLKLKLTSSRSVTPMTNGVSPTVANKVQPTSTSGWNNIINNGSGTQPPMAFPPAMFPPFLPPAFGCFPGATGGCDPLMLMQFMRILGEKQRLQQRQAPASVSNIFPVQVPSGSLMAPTSNSQPELSSSNESADNKQRLSSILLRNGNGISHEADGESADNVSPIDGDIDDDADGLIKLSNNNSGHNSSGGEDMDGDGESPTPSDRSSTRNRTGAYSLHDVAGASLDKPYECQHANCHKRFGNKFLLKKHEFIHTGERPHVCPYCGKRFNRKDNLLRHKKTHMANALANERRRQTMVFGVDSLISAAAAAAARAEQAPSGVQQQQQHLHGTDSNDSSNTALHHPRSLAGLGSPSCSASSPAIVNTNAFTPGEVHASRTSA